MAFCFAWAFSTSSRVHNDIPVWFSLGFWDIVRIKSLESVSAMSVDKLDAVSVIYWLIHRGSLALLSALAKRYIKQSRWEIWLLSKRRKQPYQQISLAPNPFYPSVLALHIEQHFALHQTPGIQILVFDKHRAGILDELSEYDFQCIDTEHCKPPLDEKKTKLKSRHTQT